MNLVAGAKVSIVDPTPGVTRDRVSAIVELPAPNNAGPPKTVEFLDTGGFGAYTAPGERFDEVGEDLHRLTNSIEFQIGQAIGDADLVLFVIDAQDGVTTQDQHIARLIREGKLSARGGTPPPGGKPTPGAPKAAPTVRVVANKTDGPRWEAHAAEAAGLGFGEPIMVSAKNNYMRREFLDEIHGLVPETTEAPEPTADLRVAIVGKRNAGKSTLINTLAGEPRVIVSEIAGTTRDAVDIRFEFDGRSVLAIDTAGVRRQKSFQSMIEFFAFDRVKRAIDRADVVLLMVDATVKISQVDEQVAMLAQKSYKPTIIVVNKWDLAEGRPNPKGRPVTTADYEEYLRKELGGLTHAPIAFISGKSGRNVKATLNLAFELKAQAATRVTTGMLNRLVRGIMETRSPSDTTGRRGKVFYVAQTGTNPPTITLVVNEPTLFKPGFLRFLMNRFRESLPFVEVPMRLVVRARKQREGDLALDPEARVRTREGAFKMRGPNDRFRTHPADPHHPHHPHHPDTAGDGPEERELSPAELDEMASAPAGFFDDAGPASGDGPDPDPKSYFED